MNVQRINENLTSKIGRVCFSIVLITIFITDFIKLLSIPLILYSFFSIIIFIFANKVNSISYLVMLIPFASVIPFNEIVLLFCIISSIRDKVKLPVSIFIPFFALMTLEIIGELRCGGYLISSSYLFFFLYCVFYICNVIVKKESCLIIIKSYVFSVTCVILYSLIVAMKYATIERFFSGYYRLGESTYFINDAFNIGSNGLGMLCIISVAFILYLRKNKDIDKTFSVIGIVFFTVAGLLTQSKGFLVGFAFLILYIIFNNKSIYNALKYTTLLFIIISAAIVLITKFAPNIIDAIINRWEVDDLSTGRIDITRHYLSTIFDDPVSFIIGAGLDAYPNYFKAIASAHNATLEVLLSWGVLGVITIILLFISLINHRIKLTKLRKRSLIYLPFLSLILMVQNTRLFRTYSSILLIAVTLCTLYDEEEYSSF